MGSERELRQRRRRRARTPALASEPVSARRRCSGPDGEHDLLLPARRGKQLRDDGGEGGSSRPRVRRGSRTNRRARSGTKRRRSKPRSTRTSWPANTTSNTAKRPRMAAKRRRAAQAPGGRSTGRGLGRADGPEARRHLPLPRRREQRRRHDRRPDQTFTTMPPASIDSESRSRSQRHRSDAADADQPVGARHQLLLPVRHRQLRSRPSRLHRCASPARRDIGAGESDVARQRPAPGTPAGDDLLLPRARHATRSAPPQASSTPSRRSRAAARRACQTGGRGRWSPRPTSTARPSKR